MNMYKKNLKNCIVAGCVALAAGACSFSVNGAEKDAKNREIEELQAEINAVALRLDSLGANALLAMHTERVRALPEEERARAAYEILPDILNLVGKIVTAQQPLAKSECPKEVSGSASRRPDQGSR
jgi:hypothetical protein